jgi:thiamine biosynthesis lipoprotein
MAERSERSEEFKAIGTSWHIQFSCPDPITCDELVESVKERIELFESHYSRFREDSFVGQIAKQSGTYHLPPDAENMLALYKKLYDISEGKVTPLIGEVLVAAGYDKTYSLKPQASIPPAPLWEAVMEYAPPFLITKRPLQLDFGGLGKGYLIDIVAELFIAQGIDDFIINAGGDIAHRTTVAKTARIGLEDPDDSTKIIGVAQLNNKSLAGSSGNRRAWAQFHHIIDPDSTASPRHIAGVWVVADTTLVADGLTTALFFVQPELLERHFNFEYCILYSDRSAKVSPLFPAVLY